MKKYLTHLVYLLIIVFLGLFSFIHSEEAKLQTLLAVEARAQALECQELTKTHMGIAESMAAKTVEAQAQAEVAFTKAEKAEEALENCERK